MQAPQPIQYSLIIFGKFLNLDGFSTISGLVLALVNPCAHAFLANHKYTTSKKTFYLTSKIFLVVVLPFLSVIATLSAHATQGSLDA